MNYPYPEQWQKYFDKGWRIHRTSCICGGSYAWYRPRASGAEECWGCICHTPLPEDYIKLKE